MKVEIEFDLPEDPDNPMDESMFAALTVVKVASDINDGKRDGRLFDGNGNSNGTWQLTI